MRSEDHDLTKGKINNLGSWLQITAGGIIGYIRVGLDSNDYGDISATPRDWYFVSQEFTAPAGITACKLVAKADTSAAVVAIDAARHFYSQAALWEMD
jgi:hypothetical protein